MRINGRYARQFDVEEMEEPAVDPGVEAPLASEEPDYAFDGFSVEFLDKAALLPVANASTQARQVR